MATKMPSEGRVDEGDLDVSMNTTLEAFCACSFSDLAEEDKARAIEMICQDFGVLFPEKVIGTEEQLRAYIKNHPDAQYVPYGR